MAERQNHVMLINKQMLVVLPVSKRCDVFVFDTPHPRRDTTRHSDLHLSLGQAGE